jgi:hypothetical protein
MARLKTVGPEHFRALLFLDHLVESLTCSLCENELIEPTAGRHNNESVLGGRRPFIPVRLRRCAQCLLEALRKKMVLLLAFLGDHRLDGAPQLGVVALPSCANEVDEQVGAGHLPSMTLPAALPQAASR